MKSTNRYCVTFFISLAALASCGATTAPKDMSLSTRTLSEPVISHKSVKVREKHRLDTVRIGVTDVGDAATTAAGLWTGVAVEANPVFAPLGDAVPVVALPAKYGLKKLMVKLGATPARANVVVETGSAVGTCANLATLLGAAPQAAIPMGLLCAVAYNQETKRAYERDTGYTIDGVPVKLAKKSK